MVALRKESVDRNINLCFAIASQFAGSLSARRAWIEIFDPSVRGFLRLSLSARRAWIEIPTYRWQRSGIVSLSARRAWIEILAFPGVITT